MVYLSSSLWSASEDYYRHKDAFCEKSCYNLTPRSSYSFTTQLLSVTFLEQTFFKPMLSAFYFFFFAFGFVSGCLGLACLSELITFVSCRNMFSKCSRQKLEAPPAELTYEHGRILSSPIPGFVPPALTVLQFWVMVVCLFLTKKSLGIGRDTLHERTWERRDLNSLTSSVLSLPAKQTFFWIVLLLLCNCSRRELLTL